MRAKDKERLEAVNMLRETLKPGTEVYCVLRHVSRSGMMREISLHTVENGSITWITGLAAQALGMRVGKREGIKIGGCGMDMGFAPVSDLAYALYPSGFVCSGSGCPSNDHSNGHGDRWGDSYQRCERETLCTHSDHKEPGYHNSGSYALRHRWI